MNHSELSLVKIAAREGLKAAIQGWEKVGHLIRANEMFESMGMESHAADSAIPGHPFVEPGNPKVDEFVALVVDMRKSSARLKTHLSGTKVNSGFQRIYYETSALLPALAQTALFKNGHVTEYLGDGVLILFKVDIDNRVQSVKDAYNVAANCVKTTRNIVNDLIREQLDLPPLDIGAGLSMSQTLVTMVGLPPNQQPKAVGTCVWEASKLSDGTNQVNVAKTLYDAWPSEKGGTLRFEPLKSLKHNVEGFKVVSGS
jgi:class 3 adenylate cyclase